MRALLRDAQDQTRIALEVEEVVYDPKDNKLFLYTTSETCYAVSKVVRANADSIIEELVMKGYDIASRGSISKSDGGFLAS